MLKKVFLYCLILLSYVGAQAQNIPNAVTAPSSATARKLPAAYSTTPTKNYLRSFTPQVPITDTSLINMSSLVEHVVTSISYNDSYGRNVETVTKQTSPSKKDNVAASTYDEFGRAAINYLPFAATSNDGAFKTNPFYLDSVFYKTQFPNEQIIYSQAFFDGSPMNIPTKSLSVGNSWGGANVGISYGHRSNTAADSVVLWTIDINSEDDIPVKHSFYLPGLLSVKEITNEKGIKGLQYTNEKGQTVLTKLQLADVPGTAHVGWLCTYYVYDEMGQVRVVIPPKAVDAINNITNNWSFSTTPDINTNLCYAYFYDNWGRCIMKRVPGKGKAYVAYDLYNRVVMSQDARLRSTNQWTFVLYDAQSRPVKSGLITSVLSKDSVIAQASRSLAYPTLSGTYTVTSESYYDNYNWLSVNGNPFSSALETGDITGTNFLTSYNTSPDFAQQITKSNRIRGAATGSKKNILNTSSYLYSLNIYDAEGRIVQTKQHNYSGATDIATVQYDYAGRALRSHLKHSKNGSNAQTHKVLTKYSYDHTGRIKTVTKNLNGLGDKIIQSNTYNELGQLQEKSIGNGIETQQFDYNIKGWITAINKDHVNNVSTNNFFGETIAYDFGFTQTQLDGNKAGIKWKAAGESEVRAFGYGYDNSNRLTLANYSQQNKGKTAWTKDEADFSVSNLSYDANGNILSMSQRGLQIGSSALIDSLKYQYFAHSNQLQKVADFATLGGNLGDFKDSSNTNDDYTYDINGNINRDNNRRMHTLANGPGAVFNILDKADSIVIAGKATTHYYYDAGGAMVGKKVNTYAPAGKVVKEYQFLSGFVYLNDTLQYTLIEGGRIRYAKKRNSTTGAEYYTYEYDYFISDHMGNIRATVTEGRDTSTYKATMETANSAVEDALFANIYTPTNTVVNKPSGFDTDFGNQKVSVLNGTSQKVGPSLVLKVMAGDKIQINSYAFFNSTVVPPPGGSNIVPDILSALSGAIVNSSSGKILPGSTSAVDAQLSPQVTQFLNSVISDPSKPKAFLGWILFDNQFKYVSSSSDIIQVEPGASKQALVAPLQTMATNGYLYVYVSNESPQNVYFDDITIKHTTGPLMQEQAYYPYGLEMAGLSDKAINKPLTAYKFNAGSELEEEDGIGYHNTFYRKYDAQIGRFTGVDIKSEINYEHGNYNFGANNPISFNDPFGDKYSLSGTSAAGRLQKGPDGNYHQGWVSEMMWNEKGFYANGDFSDFGNGGGGGNYTNFRGYTSSNIWDRLLFGEKVRINKYGEAGFYRQVENLNGTLSQSVNYNYELNDGVYGGFGNMTTLNTVVSETQWVSFNYSLSGLSLQNKDQGLWILSLGTNFLEDSRSTFRLTNGIANGQKFSFKIYEPSGVRGMGWGGGSPARITTYKIANFAKKSGHGLVFLGVLFDGIGVYKYYYGNSNPEDFIQPVNPGKGLLNTGVAIYGLWGNPAVGAIYFGMEAFYPGGIKGAVTDNGKNIAKMNDLCSCDASAFYY